MEGEKPADNDKELTSTSSSDMGKVLSTNKEEKNDSNDTLPTSSTDASISVQSSNLDDPISSTSSEMDSVKNKAKDTPLSAASSDKSGFDAEVDLLEMTRTEKIEENVDDLVNDLETLLGESTEEFNIPLKPTPVAEKTKNVSSAAEETGSDPAEIPESEVSSNTNISTDKSVELQQSLEETTKSELEDSAVLVQPDTETVEELKKTESPEDNLSEDTIVPESDSKDAPAEEIVKEVSELDQEVLKTTSSAENATVLNTQSKNDHYLSNPDSEAPTQPLKTTDSAENSATESHTILNTESEDKPAADIEEEVPQQMVLEAGQPKSDNTSITELKNESCDAAAVEKEIPSQAAGDSAQQTTVLDTESNNQSFITSTESIVEKSTEIEDSVECTKTVEDRVDSDSEIKNENSEQVSANVEKVQEPVSEDVSESEISANIQNEAVEPSFEVTEVVSCDKEHIEHTEIQDVIKDNEGQSAPSEQKKVGEIPEELGESKDLASEENKQISDAPEAANIEVQQETAEVSISDSQHSESSDTKTEEVREETMEGKFQSEVVKEQNIIDTENTEVEPKQQCSSKSEISMESMLEEGVVLATEQTNDDAETETVESNTEPDHLTESTNKLFGTHSETLPKAESTESINKEEIPVTTDPALQTGETKNLVDESIGDEKEVPEEVLAKQVPMEIEISEINSELASQAENIDVGPVVEEPKEIDSLLTETTTNQPQDDNITEVSEEQIKEGHLEEDKNYIPIVSEIPDDPKESETVHLEEDKNDIPIVSEISDDPKESETVHLEEDKKEVPIVSEISDDPKESETVHLEEDKKEIPIVSEIFDDPKESQTVLFEEDKKEIPIVSEISDDLKESKTAHMEEDKKEIPIVSEISDNTKESETVHLEEDKNDIPIVSDTKESEIVHTEDKIKGIIENVTIEESFSQLHESSPSVSSEDQQADQKETLQMPAEPTESSENVSVEEVSLPEKKDCSLDLQPIKEDLSMNVSPEDVKVPTEVSQPLDIEESNINEAEATVKDCKSSQDEILEPSEVQEDNNELSEISKECKKEETICNKLTDNELPHQEAAEDTLNEAPPVEKVEQEVSADMESNKPTLEIVMRRKTVEQDLQNIVCLSEESSDSDTTEQPKKDTLKEETEGADANNLVETTQDIPNEDFPVPQDDDELIEVAREVEQLENSPKFIEETTSFQQTNLETIMAVASLQNECLPNSSEERQLSEKELRDIEAIRAAVASITDSSQDTYDSYIEDSCMGIENTVPEAAAGASEAIDEQRENLESLKVIPEPLVQQKSILHVDEVQLDEEEKSVLSVNISETLSKNDTSDDIDRQAVDPSSNDDDSTKNSINEVKESPIEKDTSFKIDEEETSVSGIPEPNPIETIAKETKIESEVVTETPNVQENTVKKEETDVQLPGQVEEDLKEKEDLHDSNEQKQDKTCEGVLESNKNETSKSEQTPEEKPSRSRIRKGNKVTDPLNINIDEVDKRDKTLDKSFSPKITIKPLKAPDEEVSTTSDAEGNKGSLKMTITKQSDKMHSILKVYNPEDGDEDHLAIQEELREEPIPKLIIKPKTQQVEQQHSPKMSTRSSKVYSPTSSQRCGSPKITIKPVIKPTEAKNEALSPLKITFKPVVKPEEGVVKRHSPKLSKDPEQRNHSPKITIKPIPKPTSETKDKEAPVTPKVTIKPIKRHIEDVTDECEQERSSPKITIKPVVKPPEQEIEQTTPKLKIKPIKKLDEGDCCSVAEKDKDSPKISIKPLVKPPEMEAEEEEEIKERIVLKINKGNLPTPTKDNKKREYPEEDKSEKPAKLKMKFSTTGGQTHIILEGDEGNKRHRKDSGYSGNPGKKDVEEATNKRGLDEKLPERNKRLRSSVTPDKATNDDVKIIEPKLNSPIVISEDSRSQHSADSVILDEHRPEVPDISKIADIASKTTHIEAMSVVTVGVVTPTPVVMPKRRGRPRKSQLLIREELVDSPTPSTSSTPNTSLVSDSASDSGTPVNTSTSGRPKRSCRGQNVIATLGIKPRKSRGRGRGAKVNMGDREPSVVEALVEPVQTTPMKPEKDPKLTKAKLKLMQKAAEEEIQRQKEEAKEQQAKKQEEQVSKALEEKSGSGNLSKVQNEGSEQPDVNISDPLAIDESGDETRDDKTTPKKSEVTKRQKSGEKFGDVEDSEIKKGVSSSKSPKKTALEIVEIREINSDEVIVITDDESSDSKNVDEVEKDKKPKKSPETKGKGKGTPEKRKKSTEQVRTDEELDEEEKKTDEASPEESDSDSEAERQRELARLKKQEAIKKCRAKRMEKLAKAAEMKKKRQEQAAQQRAARLAAEEAEKLAIEKNKQNKRYGRYGTPKPQISLIDAPVKESEGTVKSHMGLPNPTNEQSNDDDSNPQTIGSLKNIEVNLTSSQSSGLNQKLLAPRTPEAMVVDSSEDSPVKLRRSIGTEDIVMVDEETRMSADFRVSRAQTPAKQGAIPPESIQDDSQGSVGTESGGTGKSRGSKVPKMEVFQELDPHICTVDQLAEYSWNGQGPFMLQEQVALFLGIKSFKRKYPNVQRRAVDMQERDYLKENGLATEAQCDLGLTAVNAQDILDIMYTDFQDKYEEYCKVQRERQAKELANKQKALSQFALKPGYEKMDMIEQAVQSAATWNQQFNKTRKEERKAHMDLQNLTVHYPKLKMKVVSTPKIGNYPVALVPGQFTDYYKEFTPTELNNLPLNTMCYDEIKIPTFESDSEDSSSGDESDSGSTSGSSSSGSSCDEDCKECKRHVKTELNGNNLDDVNDVLMDNNGSNDSVVLVSVTAQQ